MLVTSARGGRANVMTMSSHMMVDFVPPTVACVISDRDFTFDILRETREYVINIPTVELAKKVVACGNTSGRVLDKFKKFRLTPLPATRVAAPLIFRNADASLECKVLDASMVDKYCLVRPRGGESLDRPRKEKPCAPFTIAAAAFSWLREAFIKLPSKMK